MKGAVTAHTSKPGCPLNMAAPEFKMISKVMNAQQRRLFLRPKFLLSAMVAILLLYICLLKNEGTRQQVWRQAVDLSKTMLDGISSSNEPSAAWSPDSDGPRMSDDEARDQFKREWEELGKYVLPVENNSPSPSSLTSVTENQKQALFTARHWPILCVLRAK